MRQCSNGHFYDEVRFSACPYCARQGQQQAGKTVGLTQPAAIGKTVPLQAPAPEQGRAGKTVGILKKDMGIDPVVGFLICVEGPHKGADFRLRSGRNFLGRSQEMDVALTDDETVSREQHALISYDSKENVFLLAPGAGHGLTYHNGRVIETAVPLKAYDRIELGQCGLLFLPLCSERFRWETV